MGGTLLLIVVLVVSILIINSRKSQTTTNQTATDNTASTGNPGGGLPGNNSGNSGNQNQNQNQPGKTAVGPAKISDGPVIAPILSYDGQAVWYFTHDGHLYKENLSSGLKQEYILPSNPQIDNAIWPVTGNDFILETDSATGKTFTYYNSSTKKFLAYPKNLRSVDFMPDAKHIVYDWVADNGKSTLSIANSDSTGYKDIVDLPAADENVKAAPLAAANKVLAYKDATPLDGTLNLIVFNADLSNGKLTALKTTTNNAALWSPDGKSFIFNYADPTAKIPQLYIENVAAGTNTSLGLNTVVSKAAFDSTGRNLYVAVSSADGTGDVIWHISLDSATLDKKPIFTSAQTRVTATNLLVSPDNQTLYFKNADGYLYALPIPQ